ncbi:MAG: PHP domain-containing protein [Patescibacteria group bacterium]
MINLKKRMLFKADLHTHTIASGHAFGTVLENVTEAKKKGISLLAVTDHGPAAPGAPRSVYFKMGRRLPKVINGIRVLFGVEANIINENGDLDLPNKILDRLDLVVAGFHAECGYEDLGIEKNTDVMIKVIKNPYVKIISHPYEDDIKVDIEAVTKAAIENNVLLEVNASYFYTGKIKDEEIWSKIKMMVKILRENNQKILINSDAHSQYEIGKFQDVINKFEELGITSRDILNNDKAEILKILKIN